MNATTKANLKAMIRARDEKDILALWERGDKKYRDAAERKDKKMVAELAEIDAISEA